jgi:subtilase family serine protease
MRRFTGITMLLAITIVAIAASLPQPQAHAAGSLIVTPPMQPQIIIPGTNPATVTFQSSDGYTPQQVRGAYGVTSTFQGKGITIAIIDAYYQPTAANDFDIFSRQFGLPTIAGGCGCFQQVDINGNNPSYYAQNAGWGSETDLDIEWAHALAPQAHILLVETPDNTTLYNGFAYAAAHAQVISDSWGAAESGMVASEPTLDPILQSAGASAAVLASAGDTNSPAGYPALSPYTVAVGGTALTITGSCGTTNWAAKGCTYGSETTWDDASNVGTGGGPSVAESMPSYQTGFCNNTTPQTFVSNYCNNYRGTPDISLIAAASTPVAIYDSTADGGSVDWYGVGGTSLSSPSLAGMIADADAARHVTLTTASLTSRFTYNAATGSASAYHDITTGYDNPLGNVAGCCFAGTGYDMTSGVGSPNFLTWVMYVHN